MFGGKIDAGETPEQGVAREVFEESGLIFVAGDIFRILKNDRWRTRFITGQASGVISLDLNEHQDAGYFDAEQISALSIAFDHKDVLVSYLRSI